MTEQTGFPSDAAGGVYPDPAAVFPSPGVPAAAPAGVPQQVPTAAPEDQVAPEVAAAVTAAQLAAAAGATPGADAAATVEQIRAAAQREVLLPMESKINDLMAAMQDRAAQQDYQISLLRAQLAAAQASVGPPPVLNLAQAVKDRLQTAADTAGLPRQHWAEVAATAAQLAELAAEAVQTGDGSKLPPLAAKVARWVERDHPRASGGVRIEHFPALLDDLERLADAAAELVPVPSAPAAPAAAAPAGV